MVNGINIRAPIEIREFLNNLGVNRIKAGTSKRLNPSALYLIKIIIKFFKNNNDCYQKLLMIGDENV